MPNIVKARVSTLAPLRIENVKLLNEINLPGSFTAMVAGQQKLFKFLDHLGEPADAMNLPNEKEFDLDNPIDSRNWGVLKFFLNQYPDYANQINLYDPVSEAKKALVEQDLALAIESKIVKNRENIEWLTKLYRRVVGHAIGVTENEILKSLRQLARDNPGKFQSEGGDLIFEDSSFEDLALIDSGLEKGFFSKDLDGQILRRDGKTYAENINKALFRFQSDNDTREMLMIELSGKQAAPKDAPYIPFKENSEYVKLANEFGETVVEDILSDDLSIDQSAKEERFEEELKLNVPKLIDAGFIEKKGGPWLAIPNLDKNFRLTDLYGYFKMNIPQYENMKLRAKL